MKVLMKKIFFCKQEFTYNYQLQLRKLSKINCKKSSKHSYEEKITTALREGIMYSLIIDDSESIYVTYVTLKRSEKFFEEWRSSRLIAVNGSIKEYL